MRTALTCLCVLAAVLTFASCKRNQTGAKEHFARKYSCPEERVQVRARDDVKSFADASAAQFSAEASAAQFGQLTMAKEQAVPPAEVKNDAGRLLKWQQDQASSGAKLREHLDSLDVFQVSGCGHEVLMGCAHSPGSGGKGIDTSKVSCTETALR